MNRISRSLLCALAVIATLSPQFSTCHAQGPLAPPGAPAPTMKSLDQIEPRTPISSLPTSIVKAGSYFVTTNLTSTNNGAGISVFASDVTLDLNGYTLTGVSPATYGVNIVSGTNVVVRNGTLRDWSQAGVFAISGYHCRFENLRVFKSPGVAGLYAGTDSSVRDCTVVSSSSGFYLLDGGSVVNCYAASNSVSGISGGAGIRVERCISRNNGNGAIILGRGGLVKDCIADFNSFGGVLVGFGSIVEGTTSTSNSGDGFNLGPQSRIINSVSCSNLSYGIVLGAGGEADHCIVSFNQYGFNAGDATTISDCTVRSNANTGIYVGAGSRVLGCLVLGNAASAIYCTSSNNVVDGCQFVGNLIVISEQTGGNLIVRNSARRNLINFNSPTNTTSGPVISYGAGANLSGVITNANPWANIVY